MEDMNLKQIIAKQNEEINKLKEELNNRQDVNSMNVETPVIQKIDILTYYENKYLLMYNEIVQNRTIEISGEAEKIEEEILLLSNESEKLLNEVDRNSLVKQNIEEITSEISQKYIKLETLRFDNTNKIAIIQEKSLKELNRYNEHIDTWHDKFYNFQLQQIKSDTLIDAIKQLKDFLANDGYIIITSLKDNERIINDLFNEIENFTIETNQEVNELRIKKEEAEIKLGTISNTRLEAVKRELQMRCNQKNDYINELSSLYTALKDKHLSKLKDESIRMGLLELATKEQVPLYEELLDGFKKELLSIETRNNSKYQREKRLILLKEERDKLEAIDKERENIEAEYEYIKTIYSKLVANIKHIEDYISRVNRMIENNKVYSSYIETRDLFYKERKRFALIIKEKNEHFKLLQDRRTFIVFDPYAKESLAEVDEEIENARVDLNNSVEELKILQKNFKEIQAQAINSNICDILKIIDKYEKALPIFSEKLETIKKVSIEKYNELITIKEKLRGYQGILMQIEELEDEDKR